MNTSIGDTVAYYPSALNQRYFPSGDSALGKSFKGVVTFVEIDNYAHITIDAEPGVQVNFRRVLVFDAMPVIPGEYGYAIKTG